MLEQTVERDIESSVLHHLESIANSRAEWITTYYEERSGDVYILSTSPAVQDLFFRHNNDLLLENISNLESHKYLHTHRNTYQYEDIFLITPEGKIWWSLMNSAVINTSITSTEYNNTNLGMLYHHLFSSNISEVMISDFEINILSQYPSAFLATHVYSIDGKEILGMVAIQISNDQINNIVQDPTGLGETGETFLVGRDFLLRSDSRHTGNSTMLSQIDESPNVKTCFAFCTNPQADPWYDKVYVYNNFRNEFVVGAHAFIPDAQMALIAEMEMSEAFAPINATKASLLLMTSFFIFLILGVSLFYSRSLTKPIKQLMQGAKVIGKGNLDHTISVETHDEIQELSDSFNQMARNLKRSQEQIQQYTNELEGLVAERTVELQKKVEEIHKYSKQLEQVNNEVKQTNNELHKAQKHLQELNEQLEDKVHERTAEIEQLLKQKDEFIGHLGHDLKTPISILLNMIPLIQEKLNVAEDERDFSIVLRNVQYISNLVHETLEIAKLSSTQVQIHLTPIPLSLFIENIQEDLQALFAENKVTLKTTIDPSILVKADALQLKRVVENLLSNAVKAMPDGGTITIGTEQSKKKNMVTIVVADTGPGIAPDQLEKIFQEFYKIDESRHHLDSSGLGLSICKRIINQHGGHIWAENKMERKGAIFKFTLPIVTPQRDGKNNDQTSDDS